MQRELRRNLPRGLHLVTDQEEARCCRGVNEMATRSPQGALTECCRVEAILQSTVSNCE